ncbi:MAG TPA: WbqC family protein [Bacilli bacterium]|nr:MAG: WbqC-like protein family protein [Tenericutes bacterium ADurb.BinA124]HPX84719.1 WbqC family protein [Bacilli bacterium]
MIISSHQPHYFPWLGYLDKMAKSDLFLINDLAQLEKKSPMTRNLFLETSGMVKYLSLSVENEKLFDKENRHIKLHDCQKVLTSHKNWIYNNYIKASYFGEIWPFINEILQKDFSNLIDLQLETIILFRELFDIKTPMMYHSELNYSYSEDKNLNLINKLKSLKANIYLSGVGAKKYIDVELFERNDIHVIFQEFEYPIYRQINSSSFVNNLSALDMLFNLGINQPKNIFYENILKQKNLEKKDKYCE